MLSADTNHQVVTDYLQEVEAGRIICLLRQDSMVEVQVSFFGVILKCHIPGKWRMVGGPVKLSGQ